MKALFIFGWMLLCSFSSAQVKIGGDPKIIHPHSLLELKSMDPKSLKDRIKNNTSYTGTYFYIVHLKAPKQIEQGYIYLIKK
jgi:hypothetical protein